MMTRSWRVLTSIGVAALLVFVGAGCGDDGTTDPNGDEVDLLFEEAFSSVPDGSIPVGWTIIDQQAATVEGPSDWTVRSGRLRQASNIQAPVTSGIAHAINYEGTLAVIGDTTWTNISFRADIIPRDDDGVGMIFRWKPSAVDPDGNFYRLLMVDDPSSGGPKLRLDRRTDGVWEILEENTASYSGYAKNKKYVVEIDMVVDRFVIKINGSIHFEFTDLVADGGLTSGKVGLFCYAEQGVDFDNVKVFRRGP
jgi:hypothetical protein